MDYYQIGELPLPVLPNDAANKNYVDVTSSSAANIAENNANGYTDDQVFSLQ